MKRILPAILKRPAPVDPGLPIAPSACVLAAVTGSSPPPAKSAAERRASIDTSSTTVFIVDGK